MDKNHVAARRYRAHGHARRHFDAVLARAQVQVDVIEPTLPLDDVSNGPVGTRSEHGDTIDVPKVGPLHGNETLMEHLHLHRVVGDNVANDHFESGRPRQAVSARLVQSVLPLACVRLLPHDAGDRREIHDRRITAPSSRKRGEDGIDCPQGFGWGDEMPLVGNGLDPLGEEEGSTVTKSYGVDGTDAIRGATVSVKGLQPTR